MNTQKTNSYGRLVAFFLVAIALICALGFAASGWQSDPENKPDSGDTDENNGDTDENKDGGENTEPPEDPPIVEIKYYNALTGLEVDEATSLKRPLGFVMDPTAPMYGISGADVAIEIPVEDGATRFLMLSQGAVNLGKIGSLAPTRGYISNYAKHFGAVLVSLGNDDSIIYESTDISGAHFDLSENSGYHYTEYSHFVYTNGDLISAGLANLGINSVMPKNERLPFNFSSEEDKIYQGISATSVIITHSDTSSTEFSYNLSDNKYTLSKNGTEKRDLLNDKSVTFNNLFILFADSITYESKDTEELVMNTAGCGEGYYFAGGKSVKISWSTDISGNLTFKTESGEILSAARGNSPRLPLTQDYVAFRVLALPKSMPRHCKPITQSSEAGSVACAHGKSHQLFPL